MHRWAALGAFVSVLICANRPDVSACGDKFLFVGRVVKYQQTITASVPGSVLLYTNPASKLPAVVQEMKLDKLLSLAGHHVEAVADVGAVTRALSARRYDLLLVDAADAAQADQWKATTPGLVVVPVLYHPTKPERAAFAQTHARVLNAPANPNEMLALVNDVIKERAKTRPGRTS